MHIAIGANADIKSLHLLQKLLSGTMVIPDILFTHKAAAYSPLLRQQRLREPTATVSAQKTTKHFITRSRCGLKL